jgi:hypothetical protein
MVRELLAEWALKVTVFFDGYGPSVAVCCGLLSLVKNYEFCVSIRFHRLREICTNSCTSDLHDTGSVNSLRYRLF